MLHQSPTTAKRRCKAQKRSRKCNSELELTGSRAKKNGDDQHQVETSKSHCPRQTRQAWLPEADPWGRRGGDPVRGGGPDASSVSSAAAPAAAGPRRGGRRLAEEIGDALDDVHRPRSGASSSGSGNSASPPRRRRRRRDSARRARRIRFESNPAQPDPQVVTEVETARSREGNCNRIK